MVSLKPCPKGIATPKTTSPVGRLFVHLLFPSIFLSKPGPERAFRCLFPVLGVVILNEVSVVWLVSPRTPNPYDLQTGPLPPLPPSPRRTCGVEWLQSTWLKSRPEVRASRSPTMDGCSKPWLKPLFVGALQGNHHSRTSWVGPDFVHPQYVSNGNAMLHTRMPR